MRTRHHQYRHLASRLYGVPLLIEQSKLEQIAETFEFLRDGTRYSPEQLRERLGLELRAGDEDDDEQAAPYELVEGVAVMRLHGTIEHKLSLMNWISGGVSTQMFAGHFQQALADPNVRAIVLDVDSPGGSAYGVEELAQQIFAARGQKPLVAVANPEMFSAAYWIGSAANELAISPSAMVGSIGVYTIHRDTTAAADKAGLKFNIIRAGEYKIAANPHEPLTAESRSEVQRTVDQTYVRFLSAVARHRGTSPDRVAASYGQGRIYQAGEAVELGLADRVATLSQVVGELANRVRPSAAARGTVLHHQQPYAQAASGLAANPPAGTPIMLTKITPEVRAALQARNLINAADDDARAEFALTCFFAARGGQMPTEAAQLVAALGSTPASNLPASPSQDATHAPVSPPAAPNAQQIALAERTRIADITARGELLGVDATQIAAAVDGGLSVEQALRRFTDTLAQSQRPLDTTAASVVGSSVDNFCEAAVEVLASRCGIASTNEQGVARQLSQNARAMQHLSMLSISREYLQAAGVRVRSRDDYEIAELALQQVGVVNTVIRTEGAIHGAGSFPNLFSGLANKILDAATHMAPTTYREWASQLPNVNDFNPQTILRLGESGELPIVDDGEDYTESTTAEEPAWLSVDSFGDIFKLTPRMILGNNMGAFADLGTQKQVAHDRTLGHLCVKQLANNPTLSDGVTLFHAASHGANWIAPGGNPSQTQLDAIRETMMLQPTVGNGTVTNYLGLGPDIIVVPPQLLTDAEQTLSPYGVFPATDANINVFRGKVKYAVEPLLAHYSSSRWYALADKRLARVIVFTFLQGFENGRRETWYDPKSKSQCFSITGNFGAAAINYRGAVRIGS